MTDSAFVIDLYEYGERNRIAVLFTSGHGLVRTAARGAGSRMSRFAGALDLLNEVEATWSEREGRELSSLREARLVEGIFDVVSRDPAAAAVAAWLADHLRTFGSEHQTEPKLYRLARHVRDALRGGVPAEVVVRYVEVWTLKLTGVWPAMEACGGCGEALDEPLGVRARPFDGDGHLLCDRCASRRRGELSAEAGRLLGAILVRPLPELAPLDDAPAELTAVGAFAGAVRRAFLGKELASAKTVEALVSRG